MLLSKFKVLQFVSSLGKINEFDEPATSIGLGDRVNRMSEEDPRSLKKQIIIVTIVIITARRITIQRSLTDVLVG